MKSCCRISAIRFGQTPAEGASAATPAAASFLWLMMFLLVLHPLLNAAQACIQPGLLLASATLSLTA